MSQFKKISRLFLITTWYAFAVGVFLLAVLFGLGRVFLPYASEYKEEVSAGLSNYLAQPVSVRSLDTEWHGWGPNLVLKEVSLLDAKGRESVMRFDKARLGLDLVKSLIQWQPVLSGITLVGVDIEFSREKDGSFSIVGLAGDRKVDDSQDSDMQAVLAWIMSQQKLSLEKSDITWHDKVGAGRKMHFSAVNISLRSSGDRHSLDASVVLPKALGRSLAMHIDMQGDLMDARGRKTRAYFVGEEVKLAGLLDEQSVAGVSAAIKEADFQIWSSWSDGELQSMRGDVDITDTLLIASKPVLDENNTDIRPEKESFKNSESGIKNNLKTKLINNSEDILAKLSSNSLGSTLGGSSSEDNADKQDAMQLNRIAGKFHWQRNGGRGWSFDGTDVVLALADHQWPPSRISMKVDASNKNQMLMEASTSYLQLEDAARLMRLFSVGGEKLRTPLRAVSPRGQIFDASLRWQAGDISGYSAYARLDRASINAWRSIPAANDVYGQLWLDNNGGQMILENAVMTLDFPELFRWPLQIDELHGQVGWKIDGDAWHLTGRDLVAKNEDIISRGSLDVIKDGTDASPFMSLIAIFEDGDGGQVAHYLPTGIMSRAAVDWLDTAIVGGHVVSGGTIMHGRLSEFPFDKGNGKFEVRFVVENGSLQYANNWPVITDIDAEVQFLGRGMAVNAQHGKIFTSDIEWAQIRLPDMTVKPLNLSIRGDVKGATQEKLNYLMVSPPIRQAFGQYLEGMTADGESLLHLELDLPIGVYKDVLIKGWVDLANDSLSIQPLGRVLDNVGGRLEFFQDGLRSEAIQADLFHQSTKLQISTKDILNGNKVSIEASGLFNAPDMAAYYLPPIKDFLKGNGKWDVLFEIPVGIRNESREPSAATLHVTANLKGVEAKLPPPFNKQSEEAAEMVLGVKFMPDQEPILQLNYANFVDGIFELSEDGIAGFRRGEVRLSGGSVSLPDEPGLRVVGWLDKVALDDWINLWPDSKPVPKTVAGGQRSGRNFLHSADVAMRVLEAYGQKLHNVRLQTKPAEGSWKFHIGSAEVDGEFEIPHLLEDGVIKAKMKYCYLAEPHLGGDSLDPRELPSLDIDVDDLRYEARKFGRLKLQTTKVANGLRFEQLILRPRATTITALGGWYISGKKQNSTLQARIESTDVGGTLKTFGYVGGVDGGEGEVNLEFTWPSAFIDVDVSRVQGRLDMHLRNGQLLDVDPGAGRMFGMLSLQTLPRRLLLDFSDVFNKGFGFDRIKGIFQIDSGDAYTNNLYLEGPAARVDIAGRVGLAQQDYDQLVTVMPGVVDSLPVIGALTATPQIGAAILFVQKLFQPKIDEATKTQYTITGSWSEPIIKKVKKPNSEKIPDDVLPFGVE